MRRTASACTVFLAMMFVVATAAAQGDNGPRTVPRHISGVLGGSFTFEMVDPYGPYDFIAHGVAAGTLKHVGLARMHTTHQPNPNGDGTLVETSFEIVAANGDKIWGTYDDATVRLIDAADGDFPWVYYYKGTATLVISGGTGRFARAHGAIDATFLEAIEVFDAYWTRYTCSVIWTLAQRIHH